MFYEKNNAFDIYESLVVALLILDMLILIIIFQFHIEFTIIKKSWKSIW